MKTNHMEAFLVKQLSRKKNINICLPQNLNNSTQIYWYIKLFDLLSYRETSVFLSEANLPLNNYLT